MAITYPLIKFGSVYATEDNLSSGNRYIATVEGLEQYQLTDAVNVSRALSNKAYIQYQTIQDVPISVLFPLIDTTKYDAIRDVVQAAITGLTTFTLEITGDLGTFTFVAKPNANCIQVEQSILSGKVANFRVNCLVTD